MFDFISSGIFYHVDDFQDGICWLPMPNRIVRRFLSADFSGDFNVGAKKIIVYRQNAAILFKENVVGLQDD